MRKVCDHNDMLKILEEVEGLEHWKKKNVDDSGGKEVKNYIQR